MKIWFKLEGLDWKGSLKVGFVQVLVTRKTSKIIEFSSCRGYRYGLKKIQGSLVFGISKIDKRFLVASVFIRVSTEKHKGTWFFGLRRSSIVDFRGFFGLNVFLNQENITDSMLTCSSC